MEKCHGTSAHISYNDGQLHFFSGGERLDPFVALFDKDMLKAGFEAIGVKEIIVYGEAYGGRCQGMKETYGDKLRFIAFDIKIGDNWLNVPEMASMAEGLGFEVVPWEKSSTDVAALDTIRDRPSEIAVRRGCGNDKIREGIVCRPLIEMKTNNGERIICKHKGDQFNERTTKQKVEDPEKLIVLANSEAIANEWVTRERLTHVISHLTIDGIGPEIEQMKDVISAMVEDVLREAKGEIIESKETKSAIGRRAAQLFKERLKELLQ